MKNMRPATFPDEHVLVDAQAIKINGYRGVGLRLGMDGEK